MPKLKPHRGTKKRIKLTPTGKAMRRRAFGNHFLEKKSSARKRVINTEASIVGKVKNSVKRALGV